MTSPRLVKAGLVQLDPTSGAVRVIALQYNPENLTRSLAVQGSGAEGGDRARRCGSGRRRRRRSRSRRRSTHRPAQQTDHNAEVDQGCTRRSRRWSARSNPASPRSQDNHGWPAGHLEVLPTSRRSPCSCGRAARRARPRHRADDRRGGVRHRLNPMRVKVTVGFRVLSVDDLGLAHRGGTLLLGTCAPGSEARPAGDGRAGRPRAGGDLTCPTRSRRCRRRAVPSERPPPSSRYGDVGTTRTAPGPARRRAVAYSPPARAATPTVRHPAQAAASTGDRRTCAARPPGRRLAVVAAGRRQRGDRPRRA